MNFASKIASLPSIQPSSVATISGGPDGEGVSADRVGAATSGRPDDPN